MVIKCIRAGFWNERSSVWAWRERDSPPRTFCFGFPQLPKLFWKWHKQSRCRCVQYYVYFTMWWRMLSRYFPSVCCARRPLVVPGPVVLGTLLYTESIKSFALKRKYFRLGLLSSVVYSAVLLRHQWPTCTGTQWCTGWGCTCTMGMFTVLPETLYEDIYFSLRNPCQQESFSTAQRWENAFLSSISTVIPRGGGRLAESPPGCRSPGRGSAPPGPAAPAALPFPPAAEGGNVVSRSPGRTGLGWLSSPR